MRSPMYRKVPVLQIIRHPTKTFEDVKIKEVISINLSLQNRMVLEIKRENTSVVFKELWQHSTFACLVV